MRASVLLLLAALWTAPSAHAQIDAHLLRHPDVSATHIAFVYAGDVWTVPKAGGTAVRLSSPPGEEAFPRFSPDGQRIAFSGNYDGNTDLYVVPTGGGVPVRVTHHPMEDRMLDWYPDGEHLLFASSRASGRQRFNQFYRVPAAGGPAERLPIPFGEFGSLSPDGQRIAYTPIQRSTRTWKRYRGGMAPEVWTFDLADLTAEQVTDDPANDAHPMWHGETLYFLSDRGPNMRYNLWAHDLETGDTRQVTRFEEFDVHFPSLGPEEIVFEAGGRLYLLDLATEAAREVDVDVVTDRMALQPRVENVGDAVVHASVSPSGQRVAVEARGEVFTLPAEHGPVRNLTASSGTAERYPAWSPEGDEVAYWSDASGEYELYVRPAAGTGTAERLTSLGEGFRYAPHWSPDGKALAFIDHLSDVRILDRATGELTLVDDEALWISHGGLANFGFHWSPDGRWLAYSRVAGNDKSAVFLYDTETGTRHQATAGYYSDSDPAFSPDGDYLYYLSNREMDPVYSTFDNGWSYPNATRVMAAALRPDVPSPLAPRSDDEPTDAGAGEDGENEESEEDEGADSTEAEEEERTPVEIEVEGLERRAVILPPAAGNYSALLATEGKVILHRRPRSGSADEQSPVLLYDLEEREEQTILDDADAVQLSADGKKLLAYADGRLALVDPAPDQKTETPLRTAELETTVDPKAEWRQIFADAWRFQRDFFYDPNMHGVDWDAMRARYGALIEDAATREDVNFVLGELIGELNASHTYRGGGDLEEEQQRGVGLLGVDWERHDGAYRIARILEGAPWDAEARSPLAQPGVDVREGDYVLAVNGVPLDVERDPYAAFDGLAGRTVELLVNDAPTAEGARPVLVETLPSETRLRHLAWIEANRQRVEEATDGRAGYVYVRSTGVDGQNELVRQFTAQHDKEALVIDERFNSGGQIPDRFIELLNRPALAFWDVRGSDPWRWPPVAHFGPKVMLINGWSGSGGDAFPQYFRQAGLGPLVGERTWGGLIGISGAPALIDGGAVTVPTFRMYGPDGAWFPEGHGVEPDVEVVADPAAMARGRDPQLEAAIDIVMEQLRQAPPIPAVPAPEVRTPTGR